MLKYATQTLAIITHSKYVKVCHTCSFKYVGIENVNFESLWICDLFWYWNPKLAIYQWWHGYAFRCIRLIIRFFYKMFSTYFAKTRPCLHL
jgi:hypothetical protein